MTFSFVAENTVKVLVRIFGHNVWLLGQASLPQDQERASYTQMSKWASSRYHKFEQYGAWPAEFTLTVELPPLVAVTYVVVLPQGFDDATLALHMVLERQGTGKGRCSDDLNCTVPECVFLGSPRSTDICPAENSAFQLFFGGVII